MGAIKQCIQVYGPSCSTYPPGPSSYPSASHKEHQASQREFGNFPRLHNPSNPNYRNLRLGVKIGNDEM